MDMQGNGCGTPTPMNALGNLAKLPLPALSPLTQGPALLAGVLLRNPLALLAGGVAGGLAAGYLLHKYEKEIILALSKASGMGRDFVLHQRETLEDLLAEAHEAEAAQTASAPPAASDRQNPDGQP